MSVDFDVLYFKIRQKWWLTHYLIVVGAIHDFVVMYINADAEIDQEKLNYWVRKGLVIEGPFVKK